MLTIDGKTIRPVPTISINQNVSRNTLGMLGSSYTITLTGTILPDKGLPKILGFNNSPTRGINNFPGTDGFEIINIDDAAAAIIHKQNTLREFFSQDRAEYKIEGWLRKTPVVKFYPTLESISFEEGIYVFQCGYTVNLRAEVLFDNNNKVIVDSMTNSSSVYSSSYKDPTSYTAFNTSTLTGGTGFGESERKLISVILNEQGGFIDNYSETWSVEVDEGKGITATNTKELAIPYDHDKEIYSTRGYRLTRSINVVGKTIYDPSTRKTYPAWQMAQGFLQKNILSNKAGNPTTNVSTGWEQQPEIARIPTAGSKIGLELLNLGESDYAGYNHLRTFSIDEPGGSVTLNDSWILCSGTAQEDFNMNLNRAFDSPIHKVSINGTIKGLTSQHAGSSTFGGGINRNPQMNSAYTNALKKFHDISNDGKYGPRCHLFRRAQSLTHLPLNHVPLSIALSPNQFTGEIGYSLEYDSRPANFVSGTISESINCSDTYPGDVFAVIPVIGRATGPILQYIGGRTEYQRSLSLDLTFEQYWNSGAGLLWTRYRQLGVLSKPSLNEPYRTQIHDIVTAYSPANEVGIRKYFVSPPQETWDVKSGKYTLNITWTYELNR